MRFSFSAYLSKSTKWKLFVSHPKILNLKTKFLIFILLNHNKNKTMASILLGNQYILQENYQSGNTISWF
jgi:hypothetical protein